MASPVPAQLGGRYDIGELLGRGGMAEVHLGQDSRLGRTVAVKILRSDLARDPSFQSRFRREAHSAASLNHPNVVAVYDTGEDVATGTMVPYIVMEYVQGRTLKESQASGARLLPQRALEIVDSVLEALAYSHRQGIVHRDIKPANVMLTRAGDVKVMDFGIARAMDDAGATLTQTSMIVGTAQYASPEQAMGKQVDARSDLYSTGCLLYELLTGRPPFASDNAASVMYQHVHQDVVPPSQLDPEIPAAADAITLKALTKDREQRYQSADEMRRDIAAALAGRPVAAAPAVLTQQTQRVATTAVVAASAAATSVFPGVDSGRHARTDGPPPRENKGGRAFAYFLLALAVVAVFVIAALLANSLLGSGGTSTGQVPDLSGRTLAQAQADLRAEGLRLGTPTELADDNAPPGTITDQSPEAGTELAEGRRVNVTVSTGVAESVVPPLVGLTLEDARAALAAANLTEGDSTAVPSPRDADTVVRVRPAQGETVREGSAVALRYASGNNKVPDVTGEDESRADDLLRQAGFDPTVEEEETADAPPGEVIRQSPGAGETQELGTTVTIVVAVTPPDPTPEPTPTLPTPTAPAPSPVETPVP